MFFLCILRKEARGLALFHVLAQLTQVTLIVHGEEGAEDILASLREAFVELDPEYGLHARFSDAKDTQGA